MYISRRYDQRTCSDFPCRKGYIISKIYSRHKNLPGCAVPSPVQILDSIRASDHARNFVSNKSAPSCRACEKTFHINSHDDWWCGADPEKVSAGCPQDPRVLQRCSQEADWPLPRRSAVSSSLNTRDVGTFSCLFHLQLSLRPHSREEEERWRRENESLVSSLENTLEIKRCDFTSILTRSYRSGDYDAPPASKRRDSFGGKSRYVRRRS